MATKQDRVALVTGENKGIGFEMSRQLGKRGYHVLVGARDEARGRGAVEKLRGEGVTADLVKLDVTSAADRAAAARYVSETFDRLDVLVNNAAIAHRSPTAGIDAGIVDRLYAVNVRAPLLLIAAVVPHMVGRGRGSIVNLSSVSGVVGTPNRAPYAATKGAIDAATRSLAMELGPAGIRVNSVAPGVVDTDLWARNKAVPGVIEHVEAHTALRRWSVPDDIADVVVFLACDASRFVTGETVCADGGMARTFDLYGGQV